jgi:SAM-dependent methyltransferase
MRSYHPRVTIMAKAYPSYFYEKLNESGAAAERVVESILRYVKPRSVVDVGCGTGVFAAAFADVGISDVHGVDLLPQDPELLRIPRERFIAHDLSTPFRVDRKFDLVLSLEVAEHLPATSADVFVDTLTGLGDCVFFSAAVPEQGGYRHINEQWQDWWAEMFRARGFHAVDCLRDHLWEDPAVPFYYAQNLIAYATEAALDRHSELRRAFERTDQSSLSRIHPTLYRQKAEPRQVTARFLLRALPHAPRAAFKAVERRTRRH